MWKGIDVAQYFLSKDPERKLFTKNLVSKNNRMFYEGNARLNKYLHMAQNIYIAKTGTTLFSDALYAYDNGAVLPTVQENFSLLYDRHNCPDFTDDTKDFLDKIFIIFQDATLDDLIELSHEDDEWLAKSKYYKKQDQRMDSMARVDEYREQYEDILTVMDRMSA